MSLSLKPLSRKVKLSRLQAKPFQLQIVLKISGAIVVVNIVFWLQLAGGE